MPDYHQPQLLFEAQSGYLRERPTQRRAADVCFILIKASAFLGAIYLGVLGLPLLFFLALTGGDMTLLFTQLGNLAAHYLAADPARQALFANELKLGLLGIATLVLLWRLPVFLDQMAGALAREEQVQ
jgi:hypothetical protein